jgi:hypothetical protein
VSTLSLSSSCHWLCPCESSAHTLAPASSTTQGRRRKCHTPARIRITRILSQIALAYLAFICLAACTRDASCLLFGTSAESALHEPQYSNINYDVLRNVLAQPDSHTHHARTNRQPADSPLTHYMPQFADLSSSEAAGDNIPVNITESAHMPGLSCAGSAGDEPRSRSHDESCDLLRDESYDDSAMTSLGARDQYRAALTHVSSSSDPGEEDNCIFAHPGRKAINTTSSSHLCKAHHQPAGPSGLLAAQHQPPVQRVSFPPSGCTTLLHLESCSIVHTDPVAAALRFPHAAHRSMGFIPALCQSARGLQHIFRSLRTDWATPAINLATKAWAAVVGYSAQLAKAYARAVLDQVCDPPAVSDMLHAHMSIEAAFLSRVVADAWSVASPCVQSVVQLVVLCVLNNPVNISMLIMFVISAELVYWLMRF